MKTTATKKIYSFILVTIVMFSASLSFAQNNCKSCNGDKVKINLCTGGGYNYCDACQMKCVSSSQLQGYLDEGWLMGYCPHVCGGNARVEDGANNSANNFEILPNPVSDQAHIQFSLQKPAKVSIKIFDAAGRLIEIIVDATFEDGDYEITWNATDLKGGVYFLRLESEDGVQMLKTMVMK